MKRKYTEEEYEALEAKILKLRKSLDEDRQLLDAVATAKFETSQEFDRLSAHADSAIGRMLFIARGYRDTKPKSFEHGLYLSLNSVREVLYVISDSAKTSRDALKGVPLEVQNTSIIRPPQ